jgi:hypothetical protein
MKRVEISLRGHIDQTWSDSLGGLNVDHSPTGITILSGLVRDQSALYGLLNSLASLGLDLVTVTSFDTLQKN